MGRLFYGLSENDASVEIPDRVLAHLRVVVTTKLRRSESLTLTWVHADPANPGRTSVWLQPSIPLRFVSDSAEDEKLDPAVLRDMAADAARTGAITLDLAALAGGESEDVADTAAAQALAA